MTNDFLQAVRSTLSPEHVADEASVDEASANVEGLSERLPGVVRARSTAEVVALVRLARAHRQPLYSWSAGRNWGYGTRLPPKPGAVGLDLSGMRAIRSIDPQGGTATVEPGVTQAVLAQELLNRKLPFYVDVTGSAKETSILGNTVDRGVAYNSLRADSLRHLEVVMGDASVLRTGMAHDPNSRVADLYRHGLGPNLTELFLQSRFGVVTAACIALRPVLERQLPFRASPLPGVGLARLAEAIADVRRALRIDSIVHIGNLERAITTLAPLVRQAAERRGLNLDRARSEQIIRRTVRGDWAALGLLEGTRRQVRAGARDLVQRLSGVARVTFMPEARLKWAAKLPLVGPLTDVALVAAAASELSGLTRGVPTDAPMRALYWPFEEDEPEWLAPERGRTGWLLASPLFPARGGHVDIVVRETDSIAQHHRARHGMTLNVLSDSLLQMVISLSWPLADLAAGEAARTCQKELARRFTELGYTPYRASATEMDVLRRGGDVFWEVAARIGRALDPDGVLSPGRYSPSPS